MYQQIIIYFFLASEVINFRIFYGYWLSYGDFLLEILVSVHIIVNCMFDPCFVHEIVELILVFHHIIVLEFCP